MKSTPTFCSLGCCTLASLCSLQDQKGIALFSHCIECRQSLGSGNRKRAAGGFLIRYSIRSENWWSQTEHETLQNSCEVTWIWTRSCVECNQVSGKVSWRTPFTKIRLKRQERPEDNQWGYKSLWESWGGSWLWIRARAVINFLFNPADKILCGIEK